MNRLIRGGETKLKKYLIVILPLVIVMVLTGPAWSWFRGPYYHYPRPYYNHYGYSVVIPPLPIIPPPPFFFGGFYYGYQPYPYNGYGHRVWVPGYWEERWGPYGWERVWVPGHWEYGR